MQKHPPVGTREAWGSRDGASGRSSGRIEDGSGRERPRSPTFHEMLRPLVNAKGCSIFRSVEPLKLRTASDLDSAPAGAALPAGSLVTVVERRTLPNGAVRAAIKRAGQYEGVLGWVTLSRLGGSRSPSRSPSPTRQLEATAPSDAPAAAPAEEEVEAPADAPEGPAPASSDEAAAAAPSAAAAKAKKDEAATSPKAQKAAAKSPAVRLPGQKKAAATLTLVPAKDLDEIAAKCVPARLPARSTHPPRSTRYMHAWKTAL